MHTLFRLATRRLVLGALALFAAASAAQAFPPTIDSDVAVRVSGTSPVGPTPWASTVAEGWMHLTQETRSPAKYTGTFTDNTSGGTSYAVTADTTNATAPVVQITTRFGKFVMTMDAQFGSSSYFSTTAKSKPAMFASVSTTSLICTTHAYTTQAYNFSIDIAVGIPSTKAAAYGMTVTLIKDAEDFIVPRDPVTHAVSSLSIPTTPKPTFTKITAPGYYGTIYNNGGASAGLYFTVNYFGRNLTLAAGTDSNGSPYGGTAIISGARTAEAIGTFSLAEQP